MNSENRNIHISNTLNRKYAKFDQLKIIHNVIAVEEESMLEQLSGVYIFPKNIYQTGSFSSEGNQPECYESQKSDICPIPNSIHHYSFHHIT